jgi:FixJ family two-component response regulator
MNATICVSSISTVAPAEDEPALNLARPAVAEPDDRSVSACGADIEHVVYVIDGDGDACRAIGALLRQAGHLVRTFHDLDGFLGHACADVESCLLVEAGAQGAEGLNVLRHLTSAQTRPAVVVMLSRGSDVTTAVNVMKAGAIDVLPKPLVPQDLLGAVTVALGVDRERRASRESAMVTLQRAATLTRRERQVMALVTSGLMNKQVASALSVSEISAKIYRGNLMKKMGVRTLPDLVRAADLLSRHAEP